MKPSKLKQLAKSAMLGSCLGVLGFYSYPQIPSLLATDNPHKLLEQACHEENVPLVAIEALLDVENKTRDVHAMGCNDAKCSPYTADHGYMQINYKELALRYGVKDWLQLHTDLNLNIRLGLKHFKTCLAQGKRAHQEKLSQYKRAYACYNGGESNWTAGLPYAERVMPKLEARLAEINL